MPDTVGARSLKPYPVYKDSGLPWLGPIPEAWDIRRNGRLFSQRNETGYAELPILEVSLRTGVRVRDFEESKRKQVMSEREKYKRARRGDIAYNMMRMWQGAVGVAPVDGLVSPAYVVARPTRGTDPQYFARLFRTAAYMAEVDKYSRGIVKDRNRLYWEDFKRMPSCYPPSNEQEGIVRYLRFADQRIGRLVGSKQKLIRLLEELKQAINHHAVTRGLAPCVPRQCSGSGWLGDVPKHWRVQKLRHCGSIVGGMTPSMDNRSYWDGAIPWVTPKDMKLSAIGDSSVRVSEQAIHETGLRMIVSPSVLIVVRGMILARRVPIAWTTAPVTVNQDMKALTPSKGIDAQFLACQLNSAREALVPLIDEAGHGTRRLPTERLRDIVVAIPPVKEQASITRFLRESMRTLDSAIARAYNEIDLVREYRRCLVAAVVLGKLDVRDMAVRLPDIATERTLLGTQDQAVADVATEEVADVTKEAEA